MDRRDFLASKGTPHSVLLALAVVGPQSAAELASYVAMEMRAVSKALALLEGLGLVVLDEGRWALPAATGLSGIAGGGHDEGAVEGNAGSTVEGMAGSERAGNGAHDARRAYGVRGARSSPPPPERSSGKKYLEEEEGRTGAASKRNRVYRLLLEGGVGARSPKMAELLGLGLEPDYVAAFVAHRRQQVERGVVFPVSYLIQALVCGDPAPAAPRSEYVVPKEYEGVVMR